MPGLPPLPSHQLPSPPPPFQAQAGPSLSIPGASNPGCVEVPGEASQSPWVPGNWTTRRTLRSRSCFPPRIKSKVGLRSWPRTQQPGNATGEYLQASQKRSKRDLEALQSLAAIRWSTASYGVGVEEPSSWVPGGTHTTKCAQSIWKSSCYWTTNVT